MKKNTMTVDEANTALAIASNKESRLNAYTLLAQAASQEAFRLRLELHGDESEGYALIGRLIEASDTLTMATDYIRENMIEGDRLLGHRAIDELDQAQIHIRDAIEAL